MALSSLKISRLKKRQEFVTVAKQGNKVVASTLVLQGYHHTPAEAETLSLESRIGFTVSKKVSKRAVYRNRARRRLRAVADEMLPEYGQPGWDYVLIGRHSAIDAPFEILQRDLRYALRKLAKGNGEART